MVTGVIGRLAVAVSIAVGLVTCLRPARAADPRVDLTIADAGANPLRCVVLFGHWVTQDLGTIAPGGSVTLVMWRGQPPGALYIPRVDGRKMMIENVICGAEPGWSESRDQIPLLPVRDGTDRRFATACRTDGRVRCSAPLAAK